MRAKYWYAKIGTLNTSSIEKNFNWKTRDERDSLKNKRIRDRRERAKKRKVLNVTGEPLKKILRNFA